MRCFRSALGFQAENVPGADALCPFHKALRDERSAIRPAALFGAKALWLLVSVPRLLANRLISATTYVLTTTHLFVASSALTIRDAVRQARRFFSKGSALDGDAAAGRAVSSVLHVSLISHKQFMLSRVLRAKGIVSAYLALNTTDNDRLDIGYDYAIPMNTGRVRRIFLEIYLFWRVLSRYDVIHYHFTTFLSGADGWELKLLRRMGKVIVFHFRGCDVRWRSRNMELFPALNISQECDYPVGSCETEFQRNKLAKAREFGDLFFATTPDMSGFFEGVEHIPFIAPVGIDFDALEPTPKREGVFRVVTSSNHPGLDGIPYIRDAVRRLATEGHAIELLELIKTPFAEALSAYKSADVYVGKLRLGYYNNANIETMTMGVPNMSFIRDEFASLVPDCPIIVTAPETVYDNLKNWMARPDELRAVGMKGPEFVKRHHDPNVIIERMIARYNDAFHEKQIRLLTLARRG